MGRYCEFCLQAYEDGYFWKHIGEQHPISCENTKNSYRQYKNDALNDEEMYTRIAYHLFHCSLCKLLEIANRHEVINEAVIKDADYYLAIMVGKTVAEFKSDFDAACGKALKNVDAYEEVGQEVYDELKGLLKQLDLLFESMLKQKNIICVEKISSDAEEYRLGARLKVEVVCSLEERDMVMEIFCTVVESWASVRGFVPDEGSDCTQKDEEKTVGYVGVLKKLD